MLEVEKINVFYDDLQILYDVSIKVMEDQIVALVGSNASGKTTLVKAIIGLIRPKTGRISLFGRFINNLPTSQIISLGLSVVPEGRRLFPNLTVEENLELGVYALKDRKVKDSLDFVYSIFPRLKERKRQLARTLSGGEAQMLAIGRALMAKPKILILDEPSLGLMPKIVFEVFKLLEKIRDEGISILLIEQNVRSSLEISDFAYVLEIGKIVLEGPSQEVLKDELVKKKYLGGD